MYTYMHTQTDWISDLKLRYLCFILLCGMYYTYTHTHTHTHTYIYIYVCMYVKVKLMLLWPGDVFNIF